MSMKSNIKQSLDQLKIPEVFSLLLFVLFKVKDIPDYSVLSELCYLLDGNSLIRLLSYFSGTTITFPTDKELVVLINALLVYQFVNLDGLTLVDALKNLNDLTDGQKEDVTQLYLKIVPIINEYAINRGN